MVWWIVGGVVALGSVVLVSAIAVVTGRLRPLARSLRRLRLRAEQAEKLQASLATLQERAAALQQRTEQLQRRGGTGAADAEPG